MAGTDGYVVRGVAGRPDGAYAPDTDDLIKILAERGLKVEYQEPGGKRERLLLKSAADWWGPIIMFTQQALASGAGALLADAVREVVGKRRDPKLHIDVGCIGSGDVEIKWLRSDGPAEEVLEALKIWRGE